MIGQIRPLVKAARTRIWVEAVVGHLAASVLSGASLGLLLGLLGLALGLGRWRLALVGAGLVFLACALVEAGALTLPMPSFRRQTPFWFRREFGPVWSAVAWGLDLGQGWTTSIELVGYYALLAWAVVGDPPWGGSLVLGAYGFSRALPVVVAALGATTRSPLQLGNLELSHLHRWSGIRAVNAGALAIAAGVLFTAA